MKIRPNKSAIRSMLGISTIRGYMPLKYREEIQMKKCIHCDTELELNKHYERNDHGKLEVTRYECFECGWIDNSWGHKVLLVGGR